MIPPFSQLNSSSAPVLAVGHFHVLLGVGSIMTIRVVSAYQQDLQEAPTLWQAHHSDGQELMLGQR